MKESQKIPKVIHYFWFGHNPKPKLIQKCIASWKKYCPDYEIIEWNEDNFDITLCDYMREAYEAKKWGFVPDFARLWVIYNYGGFYLDTDVELIKSLDSLRDKKTFFASEGDSYINTGIGFGSVKGAPILKAMFEEYYKLHFKLPDGTLATDTPSPIIQTESIRKFLDGFEVKDTVQEIKGVTFYPKEYFCPFDYNTRIMHKTKNTIGIHRFAASWTSKSTKLKYYLINVPKTRLYRRVIKILGEEKYAKLRGSKK